MHFELIRPIHRAPPCADGWGPCGGRDAPHPSPAMRRWSRVAGPHSGAVSVGRNRRNAQKGCGNASGDQPRAFLEEKTGERENTLRPRDPPEKRRAKQNLLLVAQLKILRLVHSLGNPSVSCRLERVPTGAPCQGSVYA